MKFFNLNRESCYIPQIFLEKLACQVIPFAPHKVPRVLFSLDSPLPHSFQVKNEHGCKVVLASENIQNADAHIIAGLKSNIKKLPCQHLAIQTADCLPILFFYEDKSYFIGGITHAGWRGLTLGIITHTIEKLGAEAASLLLDDELFFSGLHVVMGPAVFGVRYECGEDVKHALENYKKTFFKDLNTMSELSVVFDVCADVKKDSMLASQIGSMDLQQEHPIFPDIQLLASLECIGRGICADNISIIRENTYGHAIWPSFRESKHKQSGSVKKLWTHLNLHREI